MRAYQKAYADTPRAGAALVFDILGITRTRWTQVLKEFINPSNAAMRRVSHVPFS